MSSAKLAGQPLGIVNLWKSPRQGQAAVGWRFTAKEWNSYSQFRLNYSALHRCLGTKWNLFLVGALAAVTNVTTSLHLPFSLCQCEFIRPPPEKKASVSDFNPGGKKIQTQITSDKKPASILSVAGYHTFWTWPLQKSVFYPFFFFFFTQTQHTHAPTETS